MNRRKVLRICIIIFLTIIVLIIVEVALRSLVGGVNKIIDYSKEQKEQEEIYNSEESVKQRKVEAFINNVFSAINDNDYDYIYNNLNPIYREYKFNDDKNNLIQFIKQNISENGVKKISNINRNGNSYFVLINISSGDAFKSQRYTVNITNDENLELIFGEFTSISKENMATEKDDLEYTIKYKYNTSDYLTYVVEIKNNSSENVNLNYSRIYANSYSGSEIKVNDIEPFELMPNNSKTIELSLSNKYSIARLAFEGTKNDKNINAQFIFNDGIKD